MAEPTSGSPPKPSTLGYENQPTLPFDRHDLQQRLDGAEAPSAVSSASLVPSDPPSPQAFDSQRQADASRLFDELPPPGIGPSIRRTGPPSPLGVGRISSGDESSPLDQKLKWAGYLSGLVVLGVLIWMLLHR